MSEADMGKILKRGVPDVMNEGEGEDKDGKEGIGAKKEDEGEKLDIGGEWVGLRTIVNVSFSVLCFPFEIDLPLLRSFGQTLMICIQ